MKHHIILTKPFADDIKRWTHLSNTLGLLIKLPSNNSHLHSLITLHIIFTIAVRFLILIKITVSKNLFFTVFYWYIVCNCKNNYFLSLIIKMFCKSLYKWEHKYFLNSNSYKIKTYLDKLTQHIFNFVFVLSHETVRVYAINFFSIF